MQVSSNVHALYIEQSLSKSAYENDLQKNTQRAEVSHTHSKFTRVTLYCINGLFTRAKVLECCFYTIV